MCRGLDVPCDRLVLELTEGATQPLVKLMDTLTRFRIKGIGLAIDDFGTGYSSLMQLRHLPFTEVKIDQAFIADADRSSDCRLIIKTISDLAHGLGLIATAEGVETVEQLHLVQEIGCDFVQGYLISQPMEPCGFPRSIAPQRVETPGELRRDESLRRIRYARPGDRSKESSASAWSGQPQPSFHR